MEPVSRRRILQMLGYGGAALVARPLLGRASEQGNQDDNGDDDQGGCRPLDTRLTKAYGLDGLRAGWILGPAALIARAGRINDLLTNIHFMHRILNPGCF